MDIIDIILGAKLGGGGGGSSSFVPTFGTVASVNLGTTWAGNDPYTSTVTVTGYTVTDKTMVSVLPSTAVLTQMLADGTSNIFITNNNGTLTATALGAAPTQAMTLSVLCSESDQAAAIGNLPAIVGDGVFEVLGATDLTDAVNLLNTDVSDVKNAISQKAPLIINTASGDIASFADGADGMQIRKIVGTIVPVQSGTGDPSPDNVRPISGWTGANIWHSGANLLDAVDIFDDPTTKYIGSVRRFKMSVANGTYAVSTNLSYQSGLASVFAGNSSTYNGDLTTGSNGCSATITRVVTVTDNIIVIGVRVDASAGGFVVTRDMLQNGTVKIQVETGNVATPIQSYNATPLPINWQTEAGTIYGGTVTLNEDGSADVYVPVYGYHIMPSQWSWRSTVAAWTIERSGLTPLYKNFTGGDGVVRPLACDKYKPYTYNYQANYSIAVMTYGAKRLVCKTDGTDTVTPEECTVLLELETPLTYHFDNIGQLYTYLGTNNVWIDTGAITECNYPADTKLYIDGLTEPDEDMIADANIASGKYFVVNNQLYLSTAAIAAGASIVPGTNCTATNLAEALNALNT